MSIYVVPRPVTRPVTEAKAVTGVGVNMVLTDPPLSALQNTAQQRMRTAMRMGVSVPWIRAAERVITGLMSTVPWHLEDGDDVEIDDEYAGLEEQKARMLIEKPQGLLSGNKLSRREMWAITGRHIGLCGNAFWVDDMYDANGLPGALLYVRPDRMTPAPDEKGNLRGWIIDYDARGNGFPVTIDHEKASAQLPFVHHFTLEPPDEGYFGVGLVESALMKAQLSGALDGYLLTKVNAGGRKSGILAPKTGIIDPEVYQELVQDWRMASEAQDAARRLQVVRAPIDFHDTGLDELTTQLREFMVGARDDLLGLWGVPVSKLGLHDRGKGMGATTAQEEDNETLWSIGVNPRLDGFVETVQMTLLDEWQNIGVAVELEVEPPEFEDDTPQFEKALKAIGQPLTRNERREVLGYDPLPDYGPDGKALGLAIDLPIQQTVVGQGPEPNGLFNLAPPPEPDPVPVVLPAPGMPQLGAGKLPMKARRETATMKLRAKVEKVTTPQLKEALNRFLAEQKRDIVQKIRAHAAHIASKPAETQTWFNADKWDRKLKEALHPALARMASTVSEHITESFPAKASPESAVDRALNRGAARVTGINATTRDAIATIIAQAIEDGTDLNDVADTIEGSTLFDEYRSELIARTELMDAYNGAAIGAYGDAGFTMLEAIDGDGDEECASRDGQEFSIEDADAIEDHPNGTLDWVPVMEEVRAQKAEPVVIPPPLTINNGVPMRTVLQFNESGDIIGSFTGTRTVLDFNSEGDVIGSHMESFDG